MKLEDPLNQSRELALQNAKKGLGVLKEFKKFAMRGNVVDLAVGVVIGAAFGKIVTAMVSDIITPIIGLATSGAADLKNKYIPLTRKAEGFASLADAQKAGAPVLMWGDFAASIVDFIIVAFCIFLMIKLMNRWNMASDAIAPPAEPSPTEKLLTEIRDELKKSKP